MIYEYQIEIYTIQSKVYKKNTKFNKFTHKISDKYKQAFEHLKTSYTMPICEIKLIRLKIYYYFVSHTKFDR